MTALCAIDGMLRKTPLSILKVFICCLLGLRAEPMAALPFLPLLWRWRAGSLTPRESATAIIVCCPINDSQQDGGRRISGSPISGQHTASGDEAGGRFDLVRKNG